MTKVLVVGPNLLDQSRGTFEVHHPNCAKAFQNTLERDLQRNRMEFDVDSKLEVVEIIYDFVEDEDELASYVDHEFNFLPCVGELADGREAA